MRFLVVVVVFGLISLSSGETAKEAHDKSVDCAKKCARHPSTLRCELQCEQEHQKKNPKHPNSRERSSKQKAQKTQNTPKKETKESKETKKVHPKILQKERTIKGRRVFLIRKH
jgi:hypothetical protein